MTNKITMTLKHICFIGTKKKNALVEFKKGLNVIYGPSQTGKSSVLEAIDFMFGGEKLKHIDEHDGYSNIILAIDFSDGGQFTLVRPLHDKKYKLFEGHFKEVPKDIKPTILRIGKSTKSEKSITNFLLTKLDLFPKKLKKNAKNVTENLTVRTLLPLFMVSETDIQKETSPFSSNIYTEKTRNISRLKLLLTGADDSSLIADEVIEKIQISNSAKAAVYEEFLADLKSELSKTVDKKTTKKNIEDQKNKLKATISSANHKLVSFQKEFSITYKLISDNKEKHEEAHKKQQELKSMLNRFDMLLRHYNSDIERLDAIIESGSFIEVLNNEHCNLCGAPPESQDLTHKCDGNIEDIVKSAEAEKEKVNIIKYDLNSTIEQVAQEYIRVNDNIQIHERKLNDSLERFGKIQPQFENSQTSYANLINLKSELSTKIDLFDKIDVFNTKLQEFDIDKNKTTDDNSDEPISEQALYQLSQRVQIFLKAWSLPNVEDVHFESKTYDLIINGKKRASNGKGYRAITHAAMTLGFSKFLEEKDLSRLGCVWLDSPLIAYEEAEDIENQEISETNLNESLFENLSKWETTQTIIFENKKSVPDNIKSFGNVIHFTQNPDEGRYGFFPV